MGTYILIGILSVALLVALVAIIRAFRMICSLLLQEGARANRLSKELNDQRTKLQEEFDEKIAMLIWEHDEMSNPVGIVASKMEVIHFTESPMSRRFMFADGSAETAVKIGHKQSYPISAIGFTQDHMKRVIVHNIAEQLFDKGLVQYRTDGHRIKGEIKVF